jgi:hypothetical protein
MAGRMMGGAMGKVMGAALKRPLAAAKGRQMTRRADAIRGAQKLAPSMMHPSTMGYKRGGKVGGKAKVRGDSAKNDFVAAFLSPGEIVVPRSKAKSKQAAREFVDNVIDRDDKGGKTVTHAGRKYSGGGIVAGDLGNSYGVPQQNPFMPGTPPMLPGQPVRQMSKGGLVDHAKSGEVEKNIKWAQEQELLRIQAAQAKAADDFEWGALRTPTPKPKGMACGGRVKKGKR